MHEDLVRKLTDPNKGMSKATNTPAKLWCAILTDLGIGTHELSRYIQRWLDSPANRSLDADKRSSVRGNLIKEMVRPEITWKVLMKCITVIAPFKVEVVLKLHHDRDSKIVTTHTVTNYFSQIRHESDETE